MYARLLRWIGGATCVVVVASDGLSLHPAPQPLDALIAQPEPLLQEATWIFSRRSVKAFGGVGDSSFTFGVIVGGQIIGDSTIVIADGSNGSIHYFSMNGGTTRNFGRLGPGPGEFQALTDVHECEPSTLATYDAATARITRFGPAGEVLIEKRSPVGFVILRPLTCLADGSIIAAFDRRAPIPQQSSVVRATGLLVRISSDLSAVDTLATFPGNERYFANEVGGYGELPLGRSGVVAAGAHFAVLGQTDSTRIHILPLAGGSDQLLDLPLRRYPVTAAAFRRAVEQRLEDEPSRHTQDVLRAVYAHAPQPTGNRFLRDLFVDSVDRIWVQTPALSRLRESIWRVFDARGRDVARALLPETARVLFASADHVLLRVTGPDGDQHVELFHMPP